MKIDNWTKLSIGLAAANALFVGAMAWAHGDHPKIPNRNRRAMRNGTLVEKD